MAMSRDNNTKDTKTENTKTEEASPWNDEDVEATYEEYLNNSDPSVRKAVNHNANAMEFISALYFPSPSSRLFTPPAQETPPAPESRVHAETTPFSELMWSKSIYGSKVTLRNMDSIQLKIEFYNTMETNKLNIEDYTHSKDKFIQIARRLILPREFSSMGTGAGPMAFYEYILDGTHYPKNSVLTLQLSGITLKDTFRIVLENCSGTYKTEGILPKRTKNHIINNSGNNMVHLVEEQKLQAAAASTQAAVATPAETPTRRM